MNDHAIIGTAGHIDHGKTALVKALTGYDADTLAEEKRRGITIELGFAFLDVPGFDKQIVFIDVPGHEKLIKTMVAGASSLDAALLVVAADEGINVQTREHFEILRLLGIDSGVVALTKIDLVDDEQIAAVTSDIRQLAAGSFLADAPIVPVSSVTGAGIDELKAAIVDAARNVKKRADSGIFRMPLDRVFTMRGFGTVVAGTILSGEVKIGDKLEVLPEGLACRVRGIQVHGESVQKSAIGKRTAVNLVDVKKQELRRGQVVCAPGSLTPSTRMDVRVQILSSYPEEVKNRTRVRLHVGTDEVMARLILLEDDTIGPGDSALAQLALESPTVALPKDRFVIRAFSSLHTMGGGVIVDAHAAPHKRFDDAALEALDKRQSSIVDALEQAFATSGNAPLSVADAAAGIGESEDDAKQGVDYLAGSGKIVRITPKPGEISTRDLRKETWLHKERYDGLSASLAGVMNEYYARNPYRLFMGLADLQSRFLKLAELPLPSPPLKGRGLAVPGPPLKGRESGARAVYEAILADMTGDGTVVPRDGRIGLAGREIDWRPGEQQAADRIETTYESAGYASPLESDVREQLRITPDAFENIMTALIEQKRLVRLGEKVTYHAGVLEKARKVATELARSGGGVTAAELRDALGVSRKYAVAILEYLDDTQVTARVGDKHVLR